LVGGGAVVGAAFLGAAIVFAFALGPKAPASAAGNPSAEVRAAGKGEPPKESPAQKGAAAIQGTWKAVSVRINGKDSPAEEAAWGGMVFDGDKYKVLNGGVVLDEGTFTLDAAQEPPAVDLTDKGGKTRKGIYQPDGDALKVAAADPDRERPKEFVSNPDALVDLVVLKRVEQAAVEAAKEEVKRLEGIWAVVSLEAMGKPADKEKDPVPQQVVFKDDKMTVAMKDGDGSTFLYAVDPAAKPKAMNWVKEADRTHVGGIYALDGDGLE
jgi:uncharacterized protein (TIGR03067 family)